MESTRAVLWLMVLCCGAWSTASGKKPHILYFLADDMGFSDVEWSEAAQFYTPNLRKLRDEGVEFTQFYSQAKCTASRTAIMTGRYAHNLGTDSLEVYNKMKDGYLPLKHKLLPQYLKDMDYKTHAVGKWHLGHCHVNSTPTARGFDSFAGAFGNNVDYYYHGSERKGYDWNINHKPDLKANGTYNTFLITKRTTKLIRDHFKNVKKPDPIFLYVAYLAPHTPMQVPDKYKNISRCRRLPEANYRRTNCGMVAAMDESIGIIVKNLKAMGVYDDFLILFHSDNGGSTKSGSNNFPLRGSKQTPYEGGTRTRTIMRAGPDFMSPDLPQYNNELIHVVDLVPTLYHAAGGNPQSLPADLDGQSVWPTITTGAPSNRTWMAYSMDPVRGVGALRYKKGKNDFKLIFWNYTTNSLLPGFELEDPRPLPDRDGPARPKRLPSNSTHYRLYDMNTNMYEYEPSQGAPDASLAPENQFVLRKMKAEMARIMRKVTPWPGHDFLDSVVSGEWDGYHRTGTC